VAIKNKTIKKHTAHTLAQQSLASAHLKSKLHSYYGEYPSSSQLTLHKFGRPSKNHSFTTEVVFDHILIFILKSNFFSIQDHQNIIEVHPLYSHLSYLTKQLQSYDFRPLSKIDPDFATRSSIPMDRKMQFTAALLHYNFHAASVIRFCGNNYTNTHIDLQQLRANLQNIVPDNIICYVIRALTVGAPSFINGHNSRKNFLDYYRYGNHHTITKNPSLVAKALIKEDKYNFFLPFPSWVVRFLYHLHLSPEGLVVKPGKTDRLVFDATFKISHSSQSLNTTWTHVKDEPPIWYGTAFQRHLTRIWNIRISFPLEDILLWDDDVSGAFRLVKYNPEVAAAFSAILNNILCVPVGQNFGGNTSAQNWEGIARAREYLAQHFSNKKISSLLKKHNSILSLIKFSSLSSSKTKFTPASPDSHHQGVYDNKVLINTPHNTFVDDNCIAEIRSRMPQAMAASVESLFTILGQPDHSSRRSPLSMDKYYQAECSHTKKQLGYLINTRSMTVSFPNEKFKKMINILHQWHAKRKSYMVRQAAELAGNLEFFSTITPWIRFLTFSIKHSVLLALRDNNAKISSTKSMRHLFSDSLLLEQNEDAISRKNFAFSKIVKSIWNLKTKFFITTTLRNDIGYLHTVFSSPKYKIMAPIAHIIHRDPDYVAYGDACLDGAGGFSENLQFWWFLQWPKNIEARNIKHFRAKYKSPNGHMISINLLEYVAIIISYAAAISYSSRHPQCSKHSYPTIKIFSDNKSAIAWTIKASASTSSGKSLALLLASLLVNQPLGLWSGYVEGSKNILADKISRMQTHSKKFLFSTLSQEYPNLAHYNRFHPSPELLSNIWEALLSPKIFRLTKIKNLGRFDPDSYTL